MYFAVCLLFLSLYPFHFLFLSTLSSFHSPSVPIPFSHCPHFIPPHFLFCLISLLITRDRSTLLLTRGRSTLLLTRDRSTLLLTRDRSTLLLTHDRSTLLLTHDRSTWLLTRDRSTLLLTRDRFTFINCSLKAILS